MKSERILSIYHPFSPNHLGPLGFLQGLCHQLQLLKQQNMVSVLLALPHPTLFWPEKGHGLPRVTQKVTDRAGKLELLGSTMMSPPGDSHHEVMELSDGTVIYGIPSGDCVSYLPCLSQGPSLWSLSLAGEMGPAHSLLIAKKRALSLSEKRGVGEMRRVAGGWLSIKAS